ncbi:MAG: beta-ketoacyl-ACP synthase III [Cardiobacteriaceae bacterium]|nr:beta-ketoacyl-ACP synthase III [Cardiobacteriaceae bacterium]
MPDVFINHISAFLPNAPIGNSEMEAVLGDIGGVPSRVKHMILRSNAIVSRHYAIDPATREATHSTADMAAIAVRELLTQYSETPGVLACATSYPDQMLPGHGVMVHGLLPELGACEVASLAGVCVAGMAAMKYAYQAVKSGEHTDAIACAAEAASAIMRSENFTREIEQKQLDNAKPDIGFAKDFLRWMLSDGAGAVHLSHRPNAHGISLKIRWIELLSYAHEMPVCMYAGGDVVNGAFASWKSFSPGERDAQSLMAIKQDVKLLNEHIIHYTVEKPLHTLIAKHDLNSDAIDWFLPHYSSGFFRDKVADGLTRAGLLIAQEKWFTNLATKGNTGSASIYIMLEELVRTQELKRGNTILCYIPESGRFSSCFMLLEVV